MANKAKWKRIRPGLYRTTYKGRELEVERVKNEWVIEVDGNRDDVVPTKARAQRGAEAFARANPRD